MAIIEELSQRAKTLHKTVTLSECESEDTLILARRLVDDQIANPLLVNDPAIIADTAKRAGVDISDMKIVDTTDEKEMDQLLEAAFNLAPKKYSFEDFKKLYANPFGYAFMLESVGRADCSFQGHTHSSAEVLITALRIIGMKPGISTASLFAIIETEGFLGPEGESLVFADCALNPEPDADKLASIAISTADEVRCILGWEPRVGFLSFSTDGSGNSASVEKVKEALRLTKERRPDILADGEFQLDTAIRPAIAAKKVKRHSDVAGRANVLIFPDLNSANIAIKICQNFANSLGIGHVLSGFRLPISDSSRSATIDEMIGDIVLLVLSSEQLH